MKKILCLFFVFVLCFSVISCNSKQDPISETIAKIEDLSIEKGIITFSNDVIQLYGQSKEQLNFTGKGYDYSTLSSIESYSKHITAFKEDFALQLLFDDEQLTRVILFSTTSDALTSTEVFSSVLTSLHEEYPKTDSGTYILDNSLYLEVSKDTSPIIFSYSD